MLCSCVSVSAPEAGAPSPLAAEIESAKALVGPGWPADQDGIATTSGEIYLGNLNAQIHSLTRQSGAMAVSLQPRLATLLYHRFQIEGRLEDAEKALDLMAEADRANALRGADRLAYARILLGFHDFAAARREIAAAESAGADAAAIAAVRDAVEQALHLGTLPIAEEPPRDYLEAVTRAAMQVDRGHLVKATELLRQAQQSYPDTSPLPLAWIHVQQGIAFLRFGEYQAARTFFAAAHARMPEYFLATEHLAETEALLGNPGRSAELYRQVTRQNDQPAFWHGLAGAEAALGNDAAAATAARRADAGYASLLARHPLMYADHAVDYYLDTGRPGPALELARLNFEHRQDLGAHLALAEALLASGLRDEACAHVAKVRSAGLAPPEIRLTGSPLSGCFRQD